VLEDLYSAGLVGLLSALRQFDPKAGKSFESYARLRIRGAVLDELRRLDWVPRSVHVKARQIEATLRRLEQAKGRIPTDEEMAAALNISVEEYEQWVEQVRPATFISLDSSHQYEGEEGASQSETIQDERQEDPLEGTSRRELVRLIAERLERLPDMQRKVLALYYFEDLRLREIAEVFGLTESRICQIHAKAILTIRAALHRYDPCLD
jgi:RNA polymerase sigma factor for flagellar operon FliA